MKLKFSIFKRNYCKLTLDNPDKNNIIRLVSILRSHPKKASPPEGSVGGLLFLVKYTDDTDLQNTIRQLRESVSNTTITVAWYDQSRLFPSHVYENMRNNIKYFLIVYAAAIITYLGPSVKSAMDPHRIPICAYDHRCINNSAISCCYCSHS